MTEVKNLNGTSDNKVPDGYTSWKDFWQKHKGRLFGTCSCENCTNDAVDGAHVQKVYGDGKWYIVPLCPECNRGKKGIEFKVRDNDFVWVGEK